jgi:hypothetical protein
MQVDISLAFSLLGHLELKGLLISFNPGHKKNLKSFEMRL